LTQVDPTAPSQRARRVRQMGLLAGVLAALGLGIFALASSKADRPPARPNASAEGAERAKRVAGIFYPTQAQWTTLGVEPIELKEFHSEYVTEGKIAVDEDRATPIYSPYAGRVIRLLVKPGDTVEPGQPLFTVEAADMVQAQNDFISAATALNKARSARHLAEIVDTRQRSLYEGKAVPLKEVQQARALLDAAENDARSSEVALEAARNRLRILGKTDKEISDFQESGTISPATPIYSPIGGTIVQRKVGPGQYLGSGASDPVFVIGDLSTVWITVFVREIDASKVQVGQRLRFTLLAHPDRTFEAKINYVAATLDPTTRRLLVRGTVENPQALLKPEMFANVAIVASDGGLAPAIPREAVIYEGDTARIWVARADGGIELRSIKPGLSNGRAIQALQGVDAGEKVISRGSLFIDRAAAVN
jgi:cobalt-zinc-cadmium efflux system membrane fusion protein